MKSFIENSVLFSKQKQNDESIQSETYFFPRKSLKTFFIQMVCLNIRYYEIILEKIVLYKNKTTGLLIKSHNL